MDEHLRSPGPFNMFGKQLTKINFKCPFSEAKRKSPMTSPYIWTPRDINETINFMVDENKLVENGSKHFNCFKKFEILLSLKTCY